MKTFDKYINESDSQDQYSYESIKKYVLDNYGERPVKIKNIIEYNDQKNLLGLSDVNQIKDILVKYIISYNMIRTKQYKIDFNPNELSKYIINTYNHPDGTTAYIFNDSAGSFELANGLLSLKQQLFIFKNGIEHSTEFPAYIGGNIAFYLNNSRVALIDGAYSQNKISFFEKNILASSESDIKKLFSNISKYCDIKDVLQSISGFNKNTITKIMTIIIDACGIENCSSKNYIILYLIQPEMFSDKIAKALMDKIPLNLAYFILTKHMELYSNILSCYSDKHRFIENMKEGDDIHNIGIASALERLIKHENI